MVNHPIEGAECGGGGAVRSPPRSPSRSPPPPAPAPALAPAPAPDHNIESAGDENDDSFIDEI